MFAKIKKILLSKTALIVFSLVISLGLVAGSFIYKVQKAQGYCVTPFGFLCFGGTITSMEICCNGLKLTVSPPRDGDFLLTIGSMVYMWWNPTMGQCVMGDAYMGGVCVNPFSWPPCSRSENVDGIIRQIGTTLLGPPPGTCYGEFF
ncbi:MAG: hypothetical protein WC878_00430 [Candidatus Paceibacterota bacterium]|jgi:hypothetical protein